MRYSLFFFLTILATTSFASVVSGVIKDSKGNTLPYASVQVKSSAAGTTANSSGVYRLQLEPGTYTLVCRHVGYTAVEKQVSVQGDITVDFSLEEQRYNLDEVVVTAGGEDPAYQIIRNAIKLRETHLREVKKFQCEVYIKGQLKLRDYPKKLMGEKVDFEDGDTSKRKMIFLSESVARYSVDEPRQKVEVLSTRVSGNSTGFGLASPQIISFYNDIISIGAALNPRGFVSPIADNAINFYKYKFEGTFYDNGKEVNHIRVIPRRSYEPLFSGYIDITEGDWRIYSVRLTLLKTSQMQYLDTLHIDQLFVPNNAHWLIKQQVIYPAGKILGFDFHGSFVQVYDKFNLSPKFDRHFFDNTILKVNDSANKKTRSYWDSIRPVPLLEDEARDYKKKDSLEQVRQSPAYLDSLDRKANKPSVTGILLTGYSYGRRKARVNVNFEPLLDMVNFNPVEGAVVNVAPRITKSFEGRRSMFLIPAFRYGFANKRVNGHLTMGYIFGKKYFNRLEVAAGRKVFQFNNAQPISPRSNTYSSLYWRDNFMKIYEAAFFKADYTTGLGHGVTWAVSVRYQDRVPLENTTNYSWRKGDGTLYEPNFPTEITSVNIPRHQSFVVATTVTWQPGARYIELPDRKINIGSKYPTVTFSYGQGIKGPGGSDVDFAKWRLGIADNVNLKLAGRFNYNLAVGGFIQANQVYLPDYQHYQGNRSTVAAAYLSSFQMMTYYGFSNTAPWYTTAHAEYHLNGLLTNKIPVIKKLNWFLVAGTNTLYINSNRYHSEVFVGMENILKVFRIDYIQAFERSQQFHGIRFSMPFLLSGGNED